jgi:hypothetical protein
MNTFIVLLIATFLSLGSALLAGTVCNCSDQCALIPPSDSKNPCYQGAADDAASCFKTDPLLAKGTTWSCGTCATFGYPDYLRNDPIYKSMGLWNKADSSLLSGTVCDCSGECALVPPSDSKNPCYQGAADDAAKCFNTDPLLAKGTTWSCETCAKLGYPDYLRNDPIYRSMGLWNKANN